MNGNIVNYFKSMGKLLDLPLQEVKHVAVAYKPSGEYQFYFAKPIECLASETNYVSCVASETNKPNVWYVFCEYCLFYGETRHMYSTNVELNVLKYEEVPIWDSYGEEYREEFYKLFCASLIPNSVKFIESLS